MSEELSIDAIYKAFNQARASGQTEPSWVFTDKPKEAEGLGFTVYYPGSPEYDAIANQIHLEDGVELINPRVQGDELKCDGWTASLSAETSDRCAMRGPKD